MNTVMIITSMLVVAAVGIVVGFGLGIFGEKFKVEVDEKEAAVREALPGNNCGACGFAGCDAMAKAIASGQAAVNGCPVGGDGVAALIADIMGVQAEAADKKVAYVRCSGTCDATKAKYNYSGIKDCRMATVVPGAGDKACSVGCMGFGSCVQACEFDAIHVVNGVAVVDKDACKACGKCIDACPQKLIQLVPYKQDTFVRCVNKDKGPAVKAVCSNGCIGCTLCTKQCKFDAIHMDGGVAVIDYSKCKNCGLCAAVCPAKVIQHPKAEQLREAIAKKKAADAAKKKAELEAAKAAAAAEAPKTEA
ncbi:electron transport complex, RnfABCDGE type, B subunit [[Clostridium] aminophilum]|uniref:Ion-translocating oxidoreductase complex subunit B n=1 Tax=[Clostridium] aminophilum TaxID=1526 RepID=A0A1I0C083_9FIRM|nr:RnfABCDGE type electron transport complex subunit B [[Clostridium] aminophilum]SET12128.1 electron transport complex, RnfABCDGE type, B subunit [[Clostridium] aminophilum]